MIITHSNFINNSAGRYVGYGGVLYIHSSNNVTISHSRFVNSRAVSDGGVVLATDTHVYITDSEFVNNSSPDLDYDSKGGVVSVDASFTTPDSRGIINLSIKHSQFFDNSAVTDGGVVYASGKVNITIINSEFINNNARRGGIIHVYVPGVHVNITVIHSTFISNSAVGFTLYAPDIGGVVSIGDADQEPNGGTADVTLAHSTFTSNVATGRGSVLSTDRTANIKNSSL